jgi:hypothetical protein
MLLLLVVHVLLALFGLVGFNPAYEKFGFLFLSGRHGQTPAIIVVERGSKIGAQFYQKGETGATKSILAEIRRDLMSM